MKKQTSRRKKTMKKTRSTKVRPKEIKLTWRNALKEGFGKIAGQVEGIFQSRPADLVSAIKMDHDGLRQFLKTLKDTNLNMAERRRAYALFSSLLKSHTIAEEKVAYETADNFTGKELHIKIAEGFVEHQVADDLMKRIEKTKDPLTWSAHANVLSEIVSHHLDEEDRDLLPLIRRKTPSDLDADLVTQYLKLRSRTQKKTTPKNKGALKAGNQ